MKTFTNLLAATALVAFAGAAQAASHGGALDADGDGMLTEEEFTPIADMGASFEAYDSDDDGMVSEAEYNEGVRTLAAADGDAGSLDEMEMKKLDELTRMFSGAGDDMQSTN